MRGQTPPHVLVQTRCLGGLWAPCWVSEGNCFCAQPLCRAPGSSLIGLPADLSRGIGRPLRPVGSPSTWGSPSPAEESLHSHQFPCLCAGG